MSLYGHLRACGGHQQLRLSDRSLQHPRTRSRRVSLVHLLLTQIIGGQVAALVTGPITIAAALRLHQNPQAIAVATAIGCSIHSHKAPIAHPANLLIIGPQRLPNRILSAGMPSTSPCIIALVPQDTDFLVLGGMIAREPSRSADPHPCCHAAIASQLPLLAIHQRRIIVENLIGPSSGAKVSPKISIPIRARHGPVRPRIITFLTHYFELAIIVAGVIRGRSIFRSAPPACSRQLASSCYAAP